MNGRLHVVFDLDGTLIDSLGDLAAAASELVTSFGGRALSRDEVAPMVGDGAGALVARALEAGGLDPATPGSLPRFLEIYDRRLLDTTKPYDGIPDALLLASRRARLSVLTNKPTGPSERLLQALGLSCYFDQVVGGDHAAGRKPDPAGLHALTRGATHVLLVGDSPVDAQTAANAGCAFVWARYGFGAVRFASPPATPYTLDRPADLAAALDRYGALMGA